MSVAWVPVLLHCMQARLEVGMAVTKKGLKQATHVYRGVQPTPFVEFSGPT